MLYSTEKHLKYSKIIKTHTSIYMYIFEKSGILRKFIIFAGQKVFFDQKKVVFDFKKWYFPSSEGKFDYFQ